MSLRRFPTEILFFVFIIYILLFFFRGIHFTCQIHLQKRLLADKHIQSIPKSYFKDFVINYGVCLSIDGHLTHDTIYNFPSEYLQRNRQTNRLYKAPRPCLTLITRLTYLLRMMNFNYHGGS